MKLTPYERETIILLSYFSDNRIYLRNNIIREKPPKAAVMAATPKIFSDNLSVSITLDSLDNPAYHRIHLSGTKHGKHCNL